LDTCPNITYRKAVFSDEGWNPPLYNIGAAAVDLKRLQRALELVLGKSNNSTTVEPVLGCSVLDT
jgi:hypothetical protein